jgi:hypothetical protein
VTMFSQPVIRGTVTDAETGKPIPHFEIIYGMTFRVGYPPFYQFGEAKEFSDGTYEYRMNSQSGVAEYYLRVEADGYAPAVTPPFLTSDSFNLTLHRSQDVSGRVIGLDGNPVVKAQIILVLPGSPLELFDNHLRSSANVRIAQTDSGGEFHFRPQTGKFYLLALCDAGCTFEAFDQEPHDPIELKISPWARIDASYSVAPSGSKSSRMDAWISPIGPRGGSDLSYEIQYNATNSAGRFKLDKVPAFGGNLVELGISPGFRGGVSERRWIPMRLVPGQTAQPDLRGATVVGSMMSPDGAIAVRSGFVRLTPLIESPALNWPLNASEEKGLPPPLYDFQGADHFKITGVRPGRYLYQAIFGDMPNCFRASGDLVVRAEDIGTTIDLGKLICQPIGPIEVGQAAPDILGHTLDETPIALHDFAGKFVVGVMWDSDSRASQTPLPLFGNLNKEFAANPHVALLGLNLDANDAANGIISRPGSLECPGWVNGYISQRDFPLILQLVKDRPSIFIVGPDGKLVARDVPPKEMAATLRRLIGKQD